MLFLLFSLIIDKKIDPVIGIDFGTSNSRVAVYINGKVQFIPNDEGSFNTPSIVSFNKNGILVGEKAKNEMQNNPLNTIYNIKRLLGLRFSDKELQREIKRVPYKIVNKNNHPYVQVELKNETKLFSPEEIAALILKEMKRIAEKYLGFPVEKAVISVPTHSSLGLRQAINQSGMIAGFSIQRVIHESVALFYRYKIDKNSHKNVLLIDFGGGNIDVSVINYDNDHDTDSFIFNNIVIEIESQSGDNHFGGDDLNDAVIEYISDQYYKKNNKNISNNIYAMSKLKNEVENAKRDLSTYFQTTIQIENFLDGDDLIVTLNRSYFETINHHHFLKICNLIQDSISESGISKSKISEIVLAGSSSHIPIIREILFSYFQRKLPIKKINTKKAVSYGLANYGTLFQEYENPIYIIALNVVPMTLGIEVNGSEMLNIIPRNSRYPTLKSVIITTYLDYQEKIDINIFEGENKIARKNNFIGSISLHGLNPEAKKGIEIEVTFEFDSNCNLLVKAKERKTKIQNSTIIKSNKQILSNIELEEAIKKMMNEEEKNLTNLNPKDNHTFKSSLEKTFVIFSETTKNCDLKFSIMMMLLIIILLMAIIIYHQLKRLIYAALAHD